jgi:hypothetical protein
MEVHYTGQVEAEVELIKLPLGLVELAEAAEALLVEELQGLEVGQL